MQYSLENGLYYYLLATFLGCFQELSRRNRLVCTNLKDYYDKPETPKSQVIHIFGTNSLEHYDTILKDCFINETELEVLYFERCARDIEIGAFNGLNLKYLTFEENYFPVLKANMFNVSTKDITFLRCNIEKIEPNAFGNNIKIIQIAANPLLSIIKKDMFNSPKLTNLHLTRSKIKHIENEAFADLKNLKYLCLEANHLESFNSTAIFGGPTELKALTLDRNKFVIIKSYMFTLMPKLEFLNLSLNGLKVIENGSFEQLHNLEILDLSENKIKILHDNIISNKNNLGNLFLHDNYLSFISDVLLNKLNVKNITLSNNFWQCTCLKNIYNWMIQTNVQDTCEDSKYECDDEGIECQQNEVISVNVSKNKKNICYSTLWLNIKPYDFYSIQY